MKLYFIYMINLYFAFILADYEYMNNNIANIYNNSKIFCISFSFVKRSSITSHITENSLIIYFSIAKSIIPLLFTARRSIITIITSYLTRSKLT